MPPACERTGLTLSASDHINVFVKQAERQSMDTKTLYVGNLNYQTSESALKEHFAAYDPQRVRILEGKGFGFVDVPAEQLQAAIEGSDGQELDGRPLRVNEARPREDRPRNDRGGGGGGGRGGYDRDRRGGGGGRGW